MGGGCFLGASQSSKNLRKGGVSIIEGGGGPIRLWTSYEDVIIMLLHILIGRERRKLEKTSWGGGSPGCSKRVQLKGPKMWYQTQPLKDKEGTKPEEDGDYRNLP